MGHKLIPTFFLFCIFFIIHTSSVFALGVSPGRTLIDFSPDLEKTISLTIVNTEHKNMHVVLYPEGELASYITITPESLIFAPEEYEKKVSYTVHLPPSFEKPGIHSGRILAREIAERTSTSETIVVQALLAVASAIDVRVPYPGKYLHVETYISDPKPQQPVTFLIQAQNLGVEKITSAKTTIEILDMNQRSVALLTGDQQSIEAGKRVEFLYEWTPQTTYEEYTARFRTSYDGKIVAEEQRFTVGQFALEPISISVDEFTLGKVAKFNILLKNHAPTPVTRAAAQITLSDAEKKEIASFSSAETPFPSFAMQALLAYWDTESVSPGTYEGTLLITADERALKRRVRTTVTEHAITTEMVAITGQVIQPLATAATLKKESTFALLTLLIVIINSVGWYLYLKRRNKRKFMDNF